MRRLVTFGCEGATLIGSLDAASGTTGLLIVSGGNECRMGAHRGMAHLAARIAAAGYPVLRFDRRGVGDSEGENGGWASSGPDIAAAAAALRHHQPQVTRLVALGNCDAAAALACVAEKDHIDALILTNPWTGDDLDGLPPAAAISRHYRQRLRDPRAWVEALTGRVSLAKLINGLRKLARPRPEDIDRRIAAGLATFPGPVTIVLASQDATAVAFDACYARPHFERLHDRIVRIDVPTPSHSFQHRADAAALEAAVLAALG